MSDISSMRRLTVLDKGLTLSETGRCSGQTESTTVMQSPSDNRLASSGEQGCGKPHNWHAIYCRPQQSACGRTKLFSAGRLTIYRWHLSSPRKTSTQSLMLDVLPPSGGACWPVQRADEEVFLLPRWIEGPMLDANHPQLLLLRRVLDIYCFLPVFGTVDTGKGWHSQVRPRATGIINTCHKMGYSLSLSICRPYRQTTGGKKFCHYPPPSHRPE